VDFAGKVRMFAVDAIVAPNRNLGIGQLAVITSGSTKLNNGFVNSRNQ
jgi:hypothetical protein